MENRPRKEGGNIAIPCGSNILTCLIKTLNDWLNCSKISEGPLFRPINRHGQIMDKALTSKSVALILIIKRKKTFKKQKHSFSGHSLRAGCATTATIFGGSRASDHEANRP
ncbi:hypothetical protein DB44_DS00030 [Candidatus Protochlamydia amoebophila]|uniref:Tyr recombinase domain-containing protein n=1 Tax=Candidatus Protochlamydia amoebophila TaxID=362787 RepID=A0A0C1H107_9BACT|nr:hypothetical protein DB44_DS00030 [Candidatus Protochlamydia amoebophila]